MLQIVEYSYEKFTSTTTALIQHVHKKRNNYLKMKKDVGMACQKKKDKNVKVNTQSLICLYTFSLKRDGGASLHLFFFFIFYDFLFLASVLFGDVYSVCCF